MLNFELIQQQAKHARRLIEILDKPNSRNMHAQATAIAQSKRRSIEKQLVDDVDATPAQALEVVSHLSLLPEITTSSDHALIT